MAKKEETLFKERVAKALKTLPNTWFVKIQQVSLRGIPDFLLCIGGRFVAIELKSSRRAHRNPLQEWTLDTIAKTGGHAYLVSPETWPDLFSDIKEMAYDAPDHVKLTDSN